MQNNEFSLIGDPTRSTGLYGWICPKCGAVMSPFTSFCPNCTKQNWEITCSGYTNAFNREEYYGRYFL